MYRGYVLKRTTPISPPPMQRVYCVLWGTMLLDYESEEDAKHSLTPRLVVEILGVSEWDGKGRANNYLGFLLVTHTGGTYYVSVATTEEREEWILHLRRSLECVFANPEVAPFKPSKIIQNRPPMANNAQCPITHQALNGYGNLCKSCGRLFSLPDHVQETATMLQLGCEELEKVCSDCKSGQICILWLKCMNYVHTMDLHELTESVLTNVHKFKASFRLRRRLSQRLDMAADLYDGGNLTAEEFEELRVVDHAYRREVKFEECHKLKVALEAFGDDIQTILGILLDPSLTDKGGIGAYFRIIMRIFEIADQAPDLVDFFFPQLFQVHLLQASDHSPEALRKVDMLQQALLVLAQKYPGFAIKLAWNLMAVVGDFQEKKATQVQFAACACLLLQLEMVITGIVSAIADVPGAKVLHRIMRPANHQQQELGFEIGALFLIRRKLQEAFDEEELQRQQRNKKLYNKPDSSEGPSRRRSSSSSIVLAQATPSYTPPVFPGSNNASTCLEMLYQLGVGQRRDYSEDEDAPKSDSDGQSMELHQWDGFSEQLDFIDRLSELVESLRFVDRPLRTEILRKELSKWNKYRPGSKNRTASHDGQHHQQHSHDAVESEGLLVRNKMLGWDPIRIAGEPHYRITRIVVEECRVFRTKARAPSLIVCEVMRDDIYCKLYHATVEEARQHAKPRPQQAIAHMSPVRVSTGPEDEAMRMLDHVDTLRQDSEEEGLTSSTHRASDADHHRVKSAMFSSKSRARTDSVGSNDLSHGHDSVAWGRKSFSAIHQSMQDVDQLVESSLNPAIADLHTKQVMSQVIPSASSPPSSPSPPSPPTLLTSSVSEVAPSQEVTDSADATPPPPPLPAASKPLGKPSSLTILPKSRGSSILPTNRLSASTEGILRSAGDNTRQRRGSDNTNLSLKSTIASSKASNSGKMSRSTSSSALRQEDDNSKEADFPDRDGTSLSSSPSLDDGQQNHSKKVISSAHRLLAQGIIDQAEFDKLLQCDMQFQEEVAREEALQEKSKIIATLEESLGETFQSKKERLLADKMELLRAHFSDSASLDMYYSSMSDQDYWPSCDLRSFIVKTNDDLRQEICCLQVMMICKEIFEHFGLGSMLYLKPYRIVCTGSSSGLVEVLPDAISLDALKKTPGFTTLADHFAKTYGSVSEERLQAAKHNFMASLAAYSLFSYLLQIKDRHNGNLLIDSEGHILHIDFGFLLSIAPGGSFSLETAPFKLTEEMVDLLDGLDSPLFGDFVTAFTKGFIALQANCENILSAISVLARQSSFPCFQNKPVAHILDKLRARFRSELSVKDAVKHCLDLITNSYGHYGTSQYDRFQYYTNGILP